ncbi:uncharacterized protein MYCFIDRAFT_216449 [Pseudocercospora fijiensis CIRAD86]|uniref:CFEM domain-containing protein n=1 Tax=Pseudocercospora fijiensis (strain CIRAD86) TaxID=383855 RepID=M2YNW6_PSEFD|nr:uncharacterized protein MYCFIDRAFT_216449 [Pseudocercospora fijiensis CIRAD86]EME79440.1 hypothetical protein MYCFIDRAFT_216449 [Pseudocercospora fijiensis CIRAD86]
MQTLSLLFLLGVAVRSSFIPECASTCVGDAIDNSLCSSADTACICESRGFQSDLRACIEVNCEEEDQEYAIAHTDQFCAAVQGHKPGLRARDAAPEPEPAAAAEAEAEAWGLPGRYQNDRGGRQSWWRWGQQQGKEQPHHEDGVREHGGNKWDGGREHRPNGYNGGKHHQPTPTKKHHKKPHKPKKTHHKKPHPKKPHKTQKTHKPHKPTQPPPHPYPHPTPTPTTLSTTCTTTKSQPDKPHTPISYPTHSTRKHHTTKTRKHHTTKTHKTHSYPTHTRYSHTTPVTVY